MKQKRGDTLVDATNFVWTQLQYTLLTLRINKVSMVIFHTQVYLFAREPTSPITRPRLAAGLLSAFCNSFKWPPAYCNEQNTDIGHSFTIHQVDNFWELQVNLANTWIPVKATKRRRMSFVPSKIRKIRRSLMTFSRPHARMYPMPPSIWIASSVQNHAASWKEKRHWWALRSLWWWRCSDQQCSF